MVAAAVVSGFYAWHLDKRHEAHLARAQAVAHPAVPAFNPPAGTLVVLPFASLDNDPQQRYFSDGITEELTSALGQNVALRVIAWDTTSHFRSSQQSANQVGRSLNVANLVYGSIERVGGKIRVSAELVSPVTGFEL